MNLFDPTQWAEVSGWFQLIAVMAGTCVLVGVKIAGDRWDDWLDERVGGDGDGAPFESTWRRRF